MKPDADKEIYRVIDRFFLSVASDFLITRPLMGGDATRRQAFQSIIPSAADRQSGRKFPKRMPEEFGTYTWKRAGDVSFSSTKAVVDLPDTVNIVVVIYVVIANSKHIDR